MNAKNEEQSIESWTGSPDPDYRGADGTVHATQHPTKQGNEYKEQCDSTRRNWHSS